MSTCDPGDVGVGDDDAPGAADVAGLADMLADRDATGSVCITAFVNSEMFIGREVGDGEVAPTGTDDGPPLILVSSKISVSDWAKHKDFLMQKTTHTAPRINIMQRDT